MARRSVYVLSEWVAYEGHEIIGVGETLEEAKGLLGKPAEWGPEVAGDEPGSVSDFPHWMARQRPDSDFFLWVITRAPLGSAGPND